MDESRVWSILFQLTLALHECHTRKEKILHRDIKPGVCVCARARRIPAVFNDGRRLRGAYAIAARQYHIHAFTHPNTAANVFIDKTGAVKLGDFGLARVLGKVGTHCSSIINHYY